MPIYIASSGSELQAYDLRWRCLFHPNAKRQSGYGNAGGGIGPYSYCSICCRVLSKSQDPEGQPREVESDPLEEKIPSVPTAKPKEPTCE